MIEIKINWEYCYKNNYRNDVAKAVKHYLAQGDDFKYSVDGYGGFILYPQSLNPFLRIMETMNETRNIIVLPAYNVDDIDPCNSNKPAYCIIKAETQSRVIETIILSEP